MWQNVSNEFFLAWFKFQTKIASRPFSIHYDSFLQNATDIVSKCNSYFITKCVRSLLENASSFLLQNVTVLLQKATIDTKCAVYCKLKKGLSGLNICKYLLNKKLYEIKVCELDLNKSKYCGKTVNKQIFISFTYLFMSFILLWRKIT